MNKAPAASEPHANQFAGKTFVITGTLTRRAKSDAQMSMEARGGRVGRRAVEDVRAIISTTRAGAERHW